MLTFSLNPDSFEVANIIGSIGRPRTNVGYEMLSKIIIDSIDSRGSDILNTDSYAQKMHSNDMAKYGNREVPFTDEVANEISVSESISTYGVFDEDDYADMHEAAAVVGDFAELIEIQGLIMHGCDLPRIMLKILDYIEKDEKSPSHIISDEDALICESLCIKVRKAVCTPPYNALLKLKREHLRAKIKNAQADLTAYKKYVSTLCKPYRHSNTYADRKAIKEIHAGHVEEVTEREQSIELLQEELDLLKPEEAISYFDYVRLLLFKTGLDTAVQEALNNKHLWAGLVYLWSEGTQGYDPALSV